MAETATKKEHDPFGGIKSWWPILVMIVGLAVQWGIVSQQIVQLKSEQFAVEQRLIKANEEQSRHFDSVDQQVVAKVSDAERTLVEIKVQLSAIQRDILYIRQGLEEHMRIAGK
jgi:hypothetical protein